MKNGYQLMIIIVLLVTSTTLIGSAFIGPKTAISNINSIVNANEREAYQIFANQTQPTQEQVTITLYVHDGDINGPMLPDVQVTGQDAAGNSFDQMTDSNGSVVINGQPGP